jgi:metal-responsive CopG/Arc/MetJ family transcriptional regulator
MSTVSVKVPERLKKDAEETAESLGYTGLSEFIRDSMRDKIEEQLQLRQEIAERIQYVREHKGEIETYTLDEAKDILER